MAVHNDKEQKEEDIIRKYFVRMGLPFVLLSILALCFAVGMKHEIAVGLLSTVLVAFLCFLAIRREGKIELRFLRDKKQNERNEVWKSLAHTSLPLINYAAVGLFFFNTMKTFENAPTTSVYLAVLNGFGLVCYFWAFVLHGLRLRVFAFVGLWIECCMFQIFLVHFVWPGHEIVVGPICTVLMVLVLVYELYLARLCRTRKGKLERKILGKGSAEEEARMLQESGASDEGYYARALVNYEAETETTFKLRHFLEILKGSPKWMQSEVPKFAAKSEGGSKRYKSYGSSSFNTQYGGASINLNVNVDADEEDEVQEIQRPMGRDKAKDAAKKKGSRASGSSSVNDEVLARLMVSEIKSQEKEVRLAFLEIKRREVECREREVKNQEYRQCQDDIRFYLHPYDHLTGDARLAMKELKAEIKEKYNFPY
nr:hypothetical protein [Tanacetum cinerariifolium]